MISSNKEEVAEWTENKKIQNKEEQGVTENRKQSQKMKRVERENRGDEEII